eukprot:15297448-Alexandrium_andersonii.AAC.1
MSSSYGASVCIIPRTSSGAHVEIVRSSCGARRGAPENLCGAGTHVELECGARVRSSRVELEGGAR